MACKTQNCQLPLPRGPFDRKLVPVRNRRALLADEEADAAAHEAEPLTGPGPSWGILRLPLSATTNNAPRVAVTPQGFRSWVSVAQRPSPLKPPWGKPTTPARSSMT